MNKLKTVITGIGNRGVKIANALNKQGLLEVDYMNQNLLKEDSQKNLFILFIISSTDNYNGPMILDNNLSLIV